MRKLYKVKLYNSNNKVIYETELDAWSEESAMELAWDDFIAICYANAEVVNENDKD